MAHFSDSSARLDRLVSRVQPLFQERLREAIRRIRDEKTLDEIADLLSQGRVSEALASVERAALAFSRTWGQVYILAGEETANVVGRALEVIVSFDGVNERALRAIQQNQLRMVREFTREQADATRQALIEGIRRGLNPREQARAFRDSLGLTSYQQGVVSRYRELLENRSSAALDRALRDRRFDSSVLRAIKEEQDLSRSLIDKMVERYRQRWIKYRSEVIARTEALRAAHEGTSELYRQAIESGQLNPNELTQTWDTSRDERVRSSHAAMHGQQRRIGEPFVSGLGNFLLRPGDPDAPAEDTVQCRCALTTRFTDSLVR